MFALLCLDLSKVVILMKMHYSLHVSLEKLLQENVNVQITPYPFLQKALRVPCHRSLQRILCLHVVGLAGCGFAVLSLKKT